jgi:hypothetical protein
MNALKALALGLLVAATLAGCGDDTPAVTSPTPTGSTTETFTSSLLVRGSVWRLVTASTAGTLSATLTSASQPATVVGFGIGIRNGTGTGCLLHSAVTVPAGSAPQLSLPVDSGAYCVRIFDIGTLTESMGFTITIVRP